MWVSFISLPYLSLIGSLIVEIYHRTGITGNTQKQTHRERLNLILFPYRTYGRLDKKTDQIFADHAHKCKQGRPNGQETPLAAKNYEISKNKE